ncbi:MAG: hypothetical protein ACRCW1_10245 [Anaerotignaceae bacterium]
MDKNTITNFLRKDGKRLKADLVVLLATGILLIVVGNLFFGGENVPSTGQTLSTEVTAEEVPLYPTNDLEQRMTEILSLVEGAGKVKVMITYKGSSEIIVAQDEKLNEKTEKEAGKSMEEKSLETNAVIISSSGGKSNPLVLKEKYAEIEGVVIVAQGGEDVVVVNALTQAAQALVDVPAHKVQVFKMKS